MTFEEVELKYEMYLAENEMYDDIFSFSGMMNESVGLFMIQEGVKETIMKYITRIVNAITNAWKTFQEKLITAGNASYLKFAKNRLDGAKPTIVKEFKFDGANLQDPAEKLNNIKVVPLDNYQEMQKYLDTQEAFIKQYYPQLQATADENGNISLGDSLKKLVYKEPHEQKLGVPEIKTMYNYCVDSYKGSMESIKSDLQTVNTSSKNIERLVSQVVSAQAPAQQTVNASTDMTISLENFFIFNEADPQPSNNPGGNTAPNNNDNKKFDDDKAAQMDGNAANNGQATQKNESVQKHIVNYTKATTTILTTKMNITREIFNEYVRCIRHCVKGEPGTEGNQEDNSNTQRQEAPQVNI